MNPERITRLLMKSKILIFTLLMLSSSCFNNLHAQAPSASFTIPQNAGCVPYSVQFTNTSNNATSWFWDFGNGNHSTSEHPVNIYLNTGTFSVKLVARNAAGQVDSVIHSGMITTSSPLVVNFSASSTTECLENSLISFTNLSSNFDSCIWDFGDGVTSHVTNPVHQYMSPGLYTVTLVGYNTSQGCSSSLSKNSYINILSNPAATFSANITSTCNANESIAFQSQASSAISFQWQFGDGTTSNLPNPSHVYGQPGNYTVTLITSNQLGCSDTVVMPSYIEIRVNPVPAIQSSVPLTTCSPVYANFSTTATNVTAWSWEFGDSTTSQLSAPAHTILNSGIYPVKLQVTYANGCENQNLINITAHPRPGALYNMPNNQGCAPLSVNFIPTTPSAGNTYLWNFGDGTTSSQSNPTHIYNTAGTYSVLLTVTNSYGCTSNYASPGNVEVSQPEATFTADDLSGCVPHTVNFNHNGGGVYVYNWNFGDGTTSALPSPSHTYSAPGNYQVSLNITGTSGCSVNYTLPAPVTISNGVNNFNPVTPVTTCAPFTVNLYDNSPATTAWSWDFGDGASSNLQNTVHTYTDAGTYNVILQTQSAGSNCSQSVSPYATYIIHGGVAEFDHNQTLCPPFTATFTDQSVNAVSWFWDFGDGSTSTLQHPVHVYALPGFYSVTLTITTADGCTYTKFHYYAVSFLPLVANATATTSDTTLPMTVNFYSNSSGATAWFWDFGDGGTSNSQNPLHTYFVPGPYNINLTISNAECSFTYNYAGVTIGSGTSFPGGGNDSLHVPEPVYSCVPYEMNFSNPALNTVSWLWDFGDGDTSTTENPVHIYTDPGIYTVSLITWDNYGNTDTIIQPSSFYLTGATADFQINYANNCTGSTVTMVNNSINAVSYLWDFGDGNTSTLSNPSHTYNTMGVNYIISLSVTDSSGCTDFMARSYYAAASATINASTRRACANDTVYFTSGFLNYSSYLWDFGDGITSATANPYHLYSDSGSYQVSLTVTDSTGCTNTWTLPYSIDVSKPEAAFTYITTTNGCYAAKVEFTNISTGATSWNWDFGDGAVSSQYSPIHFYTFAGSNSVSLHVFSGGCTDSFVVNNLIVVPSLRPDFSYIQSSECLPVTATFADSSRDAVSWLWDFGDGATSTLQNPVHQYHSKPNGMVTLTVTDVNGCIRSISKPNIDAMFPEVFVEDSIGCTPFTFAVSDSSYNVSSWLWNFGDGTSSTDPSPVHTYLNNGTYSVSLTVTAPSGCTQVISPVTHVKSTGPTSQFSLNAVVSCAPTIVNFNDISTGATTWNWNFGDNNNSVLNDPVHIYNQPGIYDVTLIVSDSSGCSDTLVRPGLVHITGSVANFTVSATSGCSPWQVQFQDSSISAFNWLWNFGDGNTSSLQNPVHNFDTPGNYIVTLITHDTTGCQSVYSNPVPLNVQQPPVSQFSLTNTSGCVPHTVTISNQSSGNVNNIWNFGDGSISYDANPVHEYTVPGTYYITLVTGNGTGCRDTVLSENPVFVAASPVPSFTLSGNIGCPPLVVQFNNNSTNVDSTTTYTWNFGNGNMGSMEDPSVTYLNPGIYSVTLTATNGGVCPATTAINNIIHVNNGDLPEPVMMKSVSVSDTNSIEVTWGNLSQTNLSAYRLYRYNSSLSVFELVYTDFNPGNTSWNATTTYNDIVGSTSDSTYTYAVQAVTECDAILPIEQQNQHTSINLEGSIIDNAVHLEWNLYEGCTTGGYEIYRQDNLSGSFNIIAMVDEESAYFIDSTVYCGMLAAYRVKAVNLCQEGFEAWSDIIQLDAPGILVNQKVDIIRSTVVDDSYVFTEWAPPVLAPQLVTSFELYRSIDNLNFDLIATLPGNETNYSDYNTGVKAHYYFYKIKVNNLCELETTQGLQGSSILLGSELDGENRSVLRWSPYRDWESGVDYYVIERVDLNGNWVPVGRVDGSVQHYIDR